MGAAKRVRRFDCETHSLPDGWGAGAGAFPAMTTTARQFTKLYHPLLGTACRRAQSRLRASPQWRTNDERLGRHGTGHGLDQLWAAGRDHGAVRRQDCDLPDVDCVNLVRPRPAPGGERWTAEPTDPLGDGQAGRRNRLPRPVSAAGNATTGHQIRANLALRRSANDSLEAIGNICSEMVGVTIDAFEADWRKRG